MTCQRPPGAAAAREKEGALSVDQVLAAVLVPAEAVLARSVVGRRGVIPIRALLVLGSRLVPG